MYRPDLYRLWERIFFHPVHIFSLCVFWFVVLLWGRLGPRWWFSLDCPLFTSSDKFLSLNRVGTRRTADYWCMKLEVPTRLLDKVSPSTKSISRWTRVSGTCWSWAHEGLQYVCAFPPPHLIYSSCMPPPFLNPHFVSQPVFIVLEWEALLTLFVFGGWYFIKRNVLIEKAQ